ncbi:MAG: ParB/RepB/Spo0J family partition protein [Syntrophobacteria bacterium]
MAEARFCSIRFAEVDWQDTACLITYGATPEKLLCSIRAVGLIQNPLLQRREDGYLRVICGSRRLAVCRELDLEPVPCQVLSSSVPFQNCLRLALYDNLAQRSLNPVEKSLALNKMRACFARSQLIEELLPLLDLEPNITLFNRYHDLLQLQPVILEAVANGRLHERTAFTLTRLDPADRLAFFHLFEEFPFSMSVQEEVVELVGEIARRDACAPAEIIYGSELSQFRADYRKPLRQRAKDIRAHLQARRFPRLTARRERYAREVRQLGLPGGVRLIPPPYFEGPQWRLECTFRHADELAARLQEVAQLAGQHAFQQVMQSE